MLIKTEEFDQEFTSNLYQIAINTQKPVMRRGSYTLKPIGSVITDIDIAEYVYASPSLFSRLSQILDNIKRKGNFIFTRLHCGMYIEFIPPWSIDDNGGCIYDTKKAREWYIQFKAKNIMDEKSYKQVETILYGDMIALKDLIEIKAILRPYSKILWDMEDIKRGYKTFLGKKYELLNEFQKGYQTIAHYLYKYTIKNSKGPSSVDPNTVEYISIDFAMIDRKYIIYPPMIHEYYKGDIYKIFKTYKWYLKKEFFPEYIKVLKELEMYTGLLNRVKLISNMVKYRLLPEIVIRGLIVDAYDYGKKMNIEYRGFKYTQETTKKLNSIILEIVHKNRKYFRDRIEDRFKQEVLQYELRSDEAKKPINQKILDGNPDGKPDAKACPFFQINLPDFEYLLRLSQRAMINPEKMLECMTVVSKTFNTDIELLVKTIFDQNELYLRKVDEEIWLEEKGKLLEKVKIEDISKLQLRILRGD